MCFIHLDDSQGQGLPLNRRLYPAQSVPVSAESRALPQRRQLRADGACSLCSNNTQINQVDHNLPFLLLDVANGDSAFQYPSVINKKNYLLPQKKKKPQMRRKFIPTEWRLFLLSFILKTKCTKHDVCATKGQMEFAPGLFGSKGV